MRELTDERGSVLLIFAVALAMMFGLSALVIDHGQNLSEQRRLATATDASALAAAQAYAQGSPGCANVAGDFLTRNVADAVLLSCTSFGDTANGTYGWVIVEAQLAVRQFFAGTIGEGDVTTVRYSSAALFGVPVTTFTSGTRPMSLCAEGLFGNPAYAAWQAGPPTAVSSPIRVLYNKHQPDDCGDTTGNWGFVDFDGGSNSNGDIRDWIEFGYPNPLQPGWYEGNPGAISGSHSAGLQSLVNSGEVFWLPLAVEASGHGANVTYHLANFIAVRLTDFKVTGKQANRYIEFVIDPLGLVPRTTCCAPPSGADTGDRETVLIPLDENGQAIGVNP